MPRKVLFTAPVSVTGYHGCSRQAAKKILDEGNFIPSEEHYDWLGNGAYFWEYGPHRAREWAEEKFEAEAVVLEATIHLGRCLNLLDTEHYEQLAEAYRTVAKMLPGEEMPVNTVKGAHYLDNLIINFYCDITEEEVGSFQTVRGCYLEGEAIYSGSRLVTKNHIQIAVRDMACISNIEQVRFP